MLKLKARSEASRQKLQIKIFWREASLRSSTFGGIKVDNLLTNLSVGGKDLFRISYLFWNIQIEQRRFIWRQVEIWLLRLKNLSVDNQPVRDKVSAWIFVLVQIRTFKMFLYAKINCKRLTTVYNATSTICLTISGHTPNFDATSWHASTSMPICSCWPGAGKR